MLMKNDPKKFWLALLRNTGEGGGGGAVTGGETGTGDGEGAAAVVAGESAAAPAPAQTFLNAAGQPAEPPKEGEVKAEGEAPVAEAPAAFDLAAITLPEGVTLDEEVGKSFAEILGNAELSPQERGQSLLDLHTKALTETAGAVQKQMQEANVAAWTQANEQWRAAIKELPEFKNNPDAEAGKIMQVLKGHGAGEEFFAALDLTGAGNNPAILQVLHRLAQPFFEGGAVSGNGKAVSTKRLGDNIYTSTTKP